LITILISIGGDVGGGGGGMQFVEGAGV